MANLTKEQQKELNRLVGLGDSSKVVEFLQGLQKPAEEVQVVPTITLEREGWVLNIVPHRHTIKDENGNDVVADYVEFAGSAPLTVKLKDALRKTAEELREVSLFDEGRAKLAKDLEAQLAALDKAKERAEKSKDVTMSQAALLGIEKQRDDAISEYKSRIASMDSKEEHAFSLKTLKHALAATSYDTPRRAPTTSRSLDNGSYVVKLPAKYRGYTVDVAENDITLRDDTKVVATLPRPSSLSAMARYLYNLVKLNDDVAKTVEAIQNDALEGSYSGTVSFDPIA